MDQKCKNCENSTACVPFFLHENAMMHYSRTNKRMLIALITICATLAIVIMIFVHGNTVREKQLIDLINQRTEVTDGIQQQPGP